MQLWITLFVVFLVCYGGLFNKFKEIIYISLAGRFYLKGYCRVLVVIFDVLMGFTSIFL